MADYEKYSEGAPGYERYECPDCRHDGKEHPQSLWRQIERLVSRVQAKRVALSPDLLPPDDYEVSVMKQSKRYAAMCRWRNERAKAGLAWAEKWRDAMPVVDKRVAHPADAARLPDDQVTSAPVGNSEHRVPNGGAHSADAPAAAPESKPAAASARSLDAHSPAPASLSSLPPAPLVTEPRASTLFGRGTYAQRSPMKPAGGKARPCGSCSNCLRANCGTCINCLDKPKFGGSNTRKQPCVLRRCLNSITAKHSGVASGFTAAAINALASLPMDRDGDDRSGGEDSFSELSEDEQDEAVPMEESSADPADIATANKEHMPSPQGEDGTAESTSAQPAVKNDAAEAEVLPNSSVDTPMADAEAPDADGTRTLSGSGASRPTISTKAEGEDNPPNAHPQDADLGGIPSDGAPPEDAPLTGAAPEVDPPQTDPPPTEDDLREDGAGGPPSQMDPNCAICGFGPASGSGTGVDQCGRHLPLGLGSWIHLNCAIWSSEVFEKELGVLHQVNAAVRRARRTICSMCGMPGASVGCMAKRCEHSYHFGCALAAGVTFTPDANSWTWCSMHVPKKGSVPLPTFIDRSIRVKPLNRLHILPAWQRALAQLPPPSTANDAADAQPQSVVIRIGALRVLKLGKPQPGRAAFNDTQQVFPLGFRSRRRYFDVLGGHGSCCDYLCEIGEAGGHPTFTITHERDQSVVFRGRSAAEAWSSLLSRRQRMIHVRLPSMTPARSKLEGSLFFGFGCPAVAQMIEQLPGAKACEGFKPRYSLPEASQRAPPLPRSVSGCARTDPIVRRSSAYKFEHQMYLRPFINRGSLPTREGTSDAATGDVVDERSLSLNLRRREVESKSLGQVARAPGAAVAMLKQPFPVRVGRSPIHNWGLFTTRPVPKDGMVVEYMGQALRNSAADKKERVYEGGAFKGQGGDCYMFRLDPECVLDATMRGNIARFMNHCCTPNCYCKVIVEPDAEPLIPGSIRGHIVIFAARDLEQDEEVTYDYKFPTEAAKIACHCGSPRCLGVMN